MIFRFGQLPQNFGQLLENFGQLFEIFGQKHEIFGHLELNKVSPTIIHLTTLVKTCINSIQRKSSLNQYRPTPPPYQAQ
ncbi:hypothetical protein [Sutcliffiella horikoshii]|uniref:hypothetical protein n=1 Tax=Sutcliffiella horikoshii TaxID=79883 RepID=UPI001CFE7BAD|nr:hypothetical protein [Sutcliffiella horikoshii]